MGKTGRHKLGGGNWVQMCEVRCEAHIRRSCGDTEEAAGICEWTGGEVLGVLKIWNLMP